MVLALGEVVVVVENTVQVMLVKVAVSVAQGPWGGVNSHGE